MKIRSITVFGAVGALKRATGDLARWGAFAREARAAFTEAGYEVQTTRLAMAGPPPKANLAAFAVALEQLSREQGFEYVALGPAPTEALSQLPDVLAATQAIFASAHIVDPATGVIDGNAIRAAARVIRRAAAIEAGFGNLRFAALAHIPPGTPFFPAAYHDGGPPAFALATESADLAATATQQAQDAADAHRRLVEAIEREAARLVAPAKRLHDAHGLRFLGLDFSLAPFPDPAISIGAALEALSGAPLGAPGTLAAAATLTDAIDQARFPHTGFCGLMLPVLEDPVLGQRAAEGRLRVADLLQWSAVCGTGLDTVPLPGAVTEATLAHVLFDVAALSTRRHKPLTARLMPLPGKHAGDPVHFDFAYFADGGVLALEDAESPGLLDRTRVLPLHAR